MYKKCDNLFSVSQYILIFKKDISNQLLLQIIIYNQTRYAQHFSQLE